MKIVTVVVTCNRLALLSRALKSVTKQIRKPEVVFVISNSDEMNFAKEKELCGNYNFKCLKNRRTPNYAGALNTGIEETITELGFGEEVYFASLDDDDIWAINYLEEIERNHGNHDVLLANIIRVSSEKETFLTLPDELSAADFLRGNPGVGGSNTFVRLRTLMMAGCFDEAMSATIDRDIFVRIFQLNPLCKIIPKHLVTVYAEKGRKRVTTNKSLKQQSYHMFYYKYQHMMTEEDKLCFFDRAKTYFSLDKDLITQNYRLSRKTRQQKIKFEEKGNYEFIIGFISGDKTIATRIVDAILERDIPVDLILIINNLPDNNGFEDYKNLLHQKKIAFKEITRQEWQQNLSAGAYGNYFKKFTKINSIPLGRTILQYHLFVATKSMANPVFWILDDDVSFTNTMLEGEALEAPNLFHIINKYVDNSDALIGSVSKDAPLPTLSCMRGQLVDLFYSSQLKQAIYTDHFQVHKKIDYYYDLTDAHSDHLETPIYYPTDVEKDMACIFSGKAVSRPCLQKELKGEHKIVSNRGPNTLVFNREVLQFYPVIILEIEGRFTRRGDLFWALLNQVVSNRKIVEHTFCIDQNRPIAIFNLEKELDRSANDIIGYAFNKGILKTIEKIKQTEQPNRPKDIFEFLSKAVYFDFFVQTYLSFLSKRSRRFMMNYFRILGLIQLVSKEHPLSGKYQEQFSDTLLNNKFTKLVVAAQNVEVLKNFIENLPEAIWSFSKSTTIKLQDFQKHQNTIYENFDVKNELSLLGQGSEGVIFTDKKYVYKSFFSILDEEWLFLKEKSKYFDACPILDKIIFFEVENYRIIRYLYAPAQTITEISRNDIVTLLRFCYRNELVYTNIKANNFIQTHSGKLKLIDYGKSFEPFTAEKFVNSVKRAFLFFKYPTMEEADFKEIAKKINRNKPTIEIEGWELFYEEVMVGYT